MLGLGIRGPLLLFSGLGECSMADVAMRLLIFA